MFFSSHLRAVSSGFSAVRKVQAEWLCGWWALQTATQWRRHLEGLLLGDVLAHILPYKTMSRWDVISVRPSLTTVIKTQARWQEQFRENFVSVSIFWVITPCRTKVSSPSSRPSISPSSCPSIHPSIYPSIHLSEDRGSMFLWTIGTNLYLIQCTKQSSMFLWDIRTNLYLVQCTKQSSMFLWNIRTNLYLVQCTKWGSMFLWNIRTSMYLTQCANPEDYPVGKFVCIVKFESLDSKAVY
jgi:hypothetical protein